MKLTAPIALGPFDLDRSIGRGAMGEVWHGTHRAQNVSVAVKVLSNEQALRPEFMEAFRNEVQAVAGLNHPRIVMVMDYGEINVETADASMGRLVKGSPYLAMEFASAGSLDRLDLPLPWPHVKAIIFSLLDALAHAHARGVIHRDLKPANILVSTEDDLRPGLKLTDFGIAHALDQEREGTTEKLMGTPHYMAPEQCEGHWRDFGPWTDLYALGCVVWELITGETPFTGPSFIHLMYQHVGTSLPEFVTEIELPSAFEGWLRRLLSKDRLHRFRRAADAAAALRAIAPDLDEEDPLQSLSLSWNYGEGENLHHDPTQVSVEAFADTEVHNNQTLVKTADPQIKSRRHRHQVLFTLRHSETHLIPQSWRRSKPPEPSMQLVGAGLGLFGLRMVPFVGREKERDLVWKMLREAASQREVRALILRGAAGVGKSRLVEWICERAHELGAASILKATHSPVPGPRDGLSGLLARQLGCVGLNQDQVLRRVTRILKEQGVDNGYECRTLTELIAPSAETPLVKWGTATERYVVVTRLLQRLGAQRPIILWLEDVQWGSDTLEFIQHLSTTGCAVGISVLMTAREEALAERPVERGRLEKALNHPSASELEVSPLEAAASAELIRELLGLEGELSHRLQNRCGGNPLFAVQLVGDWVHRGVLEVKDKGFGLKEGERAQLPDNIHEVWTARIQRVLEGLDPTQARTTLALAATLGPEVDLQSWRAACSALRISMSSSLLQSMLDNRLLLPSDGGVRFAHEMLRESLVRNAMETDTWQELNKACASALKVCMSKQRGTSERIGMHLLRAGDLEAAIVPLLQGFDDRQGLNQFMESQSLIKELEALFECLNLDETHPRWGELWLRKIISLRRQMAFDAALKVAKQLESTARVKPMTALLAKSLQAQGEISRQQGDLSQAMALFEEAKNQFESCQDKAGIAQAITASASVLFQQGDLTKAKRYLNRAHGLSVQIGDERNAGRCLLLLGHTARRGGNFTSASEHYQQAYISAERIGTWIGMATTLNSLGELERTRGQLPQAESYYRQSLRTFEEIGHGESVFPRINLSMLLLEKSEFKEARAGLEEGLLVLERRGQRGALVAVHAALMACSAGLADWGKWDLHHLALKTLLAATSMIERDVAQAAEHAGSLAQTAGESARAQEAFELALAQWSSLEDQGRVLKLKSLLKSLRT